MTQQTVFIYNSDEVWERGKPGGRVEIKRGSLVHNVKRVPGSLLRHTFNLLGGTVEYITDYPAAFVEHTAENRMRLDQVAQIEAHIAEQQALRNSIRARITTLHTHPLPTES